MACNRGHSLLRGLPLWLLRTLNRIYYILFSVRNQIGVPLGPAMLYLHRVSSPLGVLIQLTNGHFCDSLRFWSRFFTIREHVS